MGSGKEKELEGVISKGPKETFGGDEYVQHLDCMGIYI